MRLFKAVLAGLAGLAAAQTDVLSRQYDPMRTSPIGSLKSCEINNLQAICTCDWQSLPKQQNKPKPAPKARVVYMFPANGDSGSNGLYYYMKSFASYMMQNEQAGEIYDYRYVGLTYNVTVALFFSSMLELFFGNLLPRLEYQRLELPKTMRNLSYRLNMVLILDR